MKQQPPKYVACSNERCKELIKSGQYRFWHEQCNKTLCFWCCLAVYKENIEKVNPKLHEKKKVLFYIICQQVLVISFPCCNSPCDFQLPALERFVLAKCIFHGDNCKSAESYEGRDGLKIGVECWKYFKNNQKQNLWRMEMDRHIQRQFHKHCRKCYYFNVKTIEPQQYQRDLGLCGNCYTAKVIRQSIQEKKLDKCHSCGQQEVPEKYTSQKGGEFLKNPFTLAVYEQTLHCNLCIYKSWKNVCELFNQKIIQFKELIQRMSIIQSFLIDRCLTCGSRVPQKQINVFQFTDMSIEAPYEIKACLCCKCHALMVGESKITRCLDTFKKYLVETKQNYSKQNNRMKIHQFCPGANQLLTFLKCLLENQQLLERQETKYFERQIKNDQKAYYDSSLILQVDNQRPQTQKLKKNSRQLVAEKVSGIKRQTTKGKDRSKKESIAKPQRSVQKQQKKKEIEQKPKHLLLKSGQQRNKKKSDNIRNKGQLQIEENRSNKAKQGRQRINQIKRTNSPPQTSTTTTNLTKKSKEVRLKNKLKLKSTEEPTTGDKPNPLSTTNHHHTPSINSSSSQSNSHRTTTPPNDDYSSQSSSTLQYNNVRQSFVSSDRRSRDKGEDCGEKLSGGSVKGLGYGKYYMEEEFLDREGEREYEGSGRQEIEERRERQDDEGSGRMSERCDDDEEDNDRNQELNGLEERKAKGYDYYDDDMQGQSQFYDQGEYNPDTTPTTITTLTLQEQPPNPQHICQLHRLLPYPPFIITPTQPQPQSQPASHLPSPLTSPSSSFTLIRYDRMMMDDNQKSYGEEDERERVKRRVDCEVVKVAQAVGGVGGLGLGMRKEEMREGLRGDGGTVGIGRGNSQKGNSYQNNNRNISYKNENENENKNIKNKNPRNTTQLHPNNQTPTPSQCTNHSCAFRQQYHQDPPLIFLQTFCSQCLNLYLIGKLPLHNTG